MKPYLLILPCLMALSASSQTKEASFKRLDSLLQKANGYTNSRFKIVKQSANERQLRMDLVEEGKKTVVDFGKINWKDFSVSIDTEDENKEYSKLTLSLDDEAEAKYYVAGKLEDEDKGDEIFVFIKTADEKAVRRELNEIYVYSWPELNNLRKMDKPALINLLTSKIRDAVKDNDATLISVNECEMKFKSGSEEYTIPTKIHEIHGDPDDEDYALFCYGKAKATIQIKSGRATESETLEHPDISLTFEKEREEYIPIQYALRRLGSMCKN